VIFSSTKLVRWRTSSLTRAKSSGAFMLVSYHFRHT
jgi:hypothetical protein